LAAVLAAKQHDLVDRVLRDDHFVGLGEMVKACQLLDAPRRVRQLTRKVEAAETGKGKAVKPVRLANWKNDIVHLKAEALMGADRGAGLGLSRTKCK
jgi:hypothetical protein